MCTLGQKSNFLLFILTGNVDDTQTYTTVRMCTLGQKSNLLLFTPTGNTHRPKLPLHVSCMTHGISFMFPL